MQIEGEKEKWQGYTLIAHEWPWSVDKFVEHLKRYAKARGVMVAPWDVSKPDGEIIVDLHWPAQGSSGYWPLCRAHVIPSQSTLKCMVEAEPGSFARRPEGAQIARELWLGYREYLEGLGIKANMAELPGPSLDCLERREQAEPQADNDMVAEQPTLAEDEGGKKPGPTARTQIRTEVSKRLKDAHPEWTQKKVATVFISYSHADSRFVDWLADKLKASGIDVWIDKWMIKVGDSITQKINEGISDSDFLIVVLSRASVNSNWVREELNAATIRNIEEEKHAFILPVLIEDCNIPTLLQHRKYADFKDDPEQVFRELLEAIQARESTSILMPTERRSSRFRFLPRKRISLEQWAAIAAIIATLIATVALLRDVLDFTWPKQNSSSQVQLTSKVMPAVRRTTAPPIVTVTPALTNQSSNVEPDKIGDIFPMFIGSTWSYSFGKVTQATDEQGSRILQSIGSYTETVVTIETGLSDKAKIIGVEITGENFMNHCAGDDFMSGDLDTWYVLDDSRLFQLCSRDEASAVATEMVHGQTQATSSVLPEYVAPFEVGKLWPAFPDIPPREDTCYQWYVESKVDVSVPAGEFKDCYRLLLYTMPDTTIRWVCPGVGLVAAEYHHHGSIEEYRAELKSFQSHP